MDQANSRRSLRSLLHDAAIKIPWLHWPQPLVPYNFTLTPAYINNVSTFEFCAPKASRNFVGLCSASKVRIRTNHHCLQYLSCPPAQNLVNDRANYPTAFISSIFYWSDLTRYCNGDPGGQCNCEDRPNGARPVCKNGPDASSRLWYAAPLTRSCESLCTCADRPPRSSVATAFTNSLSPFSDEDHYSKSRRDGRMS